MFIDFSIKDLIDILLVAYLLYQTYRLMKDSGSINIFIGILVFIGIWLIVSQVLEMKLLGSIFDKLVMWGVLLRKVFLWVRLLMRSVLPQQWKSVENMEHTLVWA